MPNDRSTIVTTNHLEDGPDTAAELLRKTANEVEADRERLDA